MVSVPELYSLIDSSFAHLDLSTTTDRDSPSSGVSSEGDFVSKPYHEAFPPSEAQSIQFDDSASDFDSELDIDRQSIKSLTSSMSVEDGDRVSEDGHLQAAAPANEAVNELVKAVDEMLEILTVKFNKITTEVFAKMDEMAQRLDELEASIKAGNNESNTAEDGS